MDRCLEIELKNVFKTFNHKENEISVLNGITESFRQTQTAAIMGASGTGKSTLIHLLAGLDSATSGSITCDGLAVDQVSSKERANLFGFVFQNPSLIAELTVIENILIAGVLGGMTWQESADKARSLLEVVGLKATGAWYPGQLSGGQKQRVALARALINRPSFLIADELTGNLDQHTGQLLIRLLLKLCEKWQMGLIISTHDPEIARMMEVEFLLKDGTLVVANQFNHPEGKVHDSGSSHA